MSAEIWRYTSTSIPQLSARRGCVSLHLLSHQEYTHSLVSPKISPEKLTASVRPPKVQISKPTARTKPFYFLPLTCQSFLGPWCSRDHRPVRPPAAPQRNIPPPVTTHPSVPPLPHPHPSRTRQTKIKSH